jgi:hypothetical protein
MFCAYGDFSEFSQQHTKGLQKSGVTLIDVPNVGKDVADRAILVDKFLFALDNPPSSSIMLISGDVDFSAALHILGQRGYNIILVTPEHASVALTNAAKFVWDWRSVACGRGIVSPTKVG